MKRHYTPEMAKKFCDEWHQAWHGNRPSVLINYYTEDVFYSDPNIPNGITGKTVLLQYFIKLLGKNPAWVWKHVAAITLTDGFLNKWTAEIPVNDSIVFCNGVCVVQLRKNLIYRNEVYFDRSELLNLLNSSS